MSSGFSNRRRLSSSAAPTHPGPMTASSTSQVLTAWAMTSVKSTPGAMVSTSMNTRSSPSRLPVDRRAGRPSH
jgi:hypothetical protein